MSDKPQSKSDFEEGTVRSRCRRCYRARQLPIALPGKLRALSQQNGERQRRANFGKELAVLGVKGHRWLGGNADIADKSSFLEDASLIVAQHFSNATEFVNETCDTGVGRTHHRSPIFHASKNRIRQMLTRTGGP